MSKLGFTSYDTVVMEERSTTQEMLDSLGDKAVVILDSFAKKVRPGTLVHEETIDRGVVVYFYKAIADMDELARASMRGEILITPEVKDENGEVTEEAVFDEVPGTLAKLKLNVSEWFGDFNTSQVSAVIDKMIQYSKQDGSGTWTFYKTEIVK